MKFLMAITFIASAILDLSVNAAEIPTPQPRVFTATVSNVRLNSRLIEQGKKGKDTVSIIVPAVIFAQPLEIKDVRKADKHSIQEVDTLIRYTKANIEGSAEEILSFWLPEERAEKSTIVNNLKMFQANRDYHMKKPGLSVIGLVFQEQTTSILLKRGPRVMGVTLAKKDGRFYLTDHPSNELDLAIIEASFVAK